MGRVQELIVGRDGKTRGAVLRLTKNERCSTLSRPLQLLYPLEIATSETLCEYRTVDAKSTCESAPPGYKAPEPAVPHSNERPPIRDAAIEEPTKPEEALSK